MRPTLPFLATTLLASCIVSPQPDARWSLAPANSVHDLRESFKNEDSGLMIVAHRGCWVGTAENSIASIENCIRLGAHVVEIDIRRTSDGVLVAIHDETLDRTTTGTGLVSEHSFEQISTLSLKSNDGGPSGRITPHKIPSLEQVLASASGRILLNIDAKGDTLAEAFYTVKSLGMLDHVIFKAELDLAADYDGIATASDGNFIFIPKYTQREAALSTFVTNVADKSPEAIELKFHSDAFLLEGMNNLDKLGARVWVNTLTGSPEKSGGRTDDLAIENPDRHWGELLEMGVSIIQTDAPSALIEYAKDNDGASTSKNDVVAPVSY